MEISKNEKEKMDFDFILCFIFIPFVLNPEEFVFTVGWTIVAIIGKSLEFFINIFE